MAKNKQSIALGLGSRIYLSMLILLLLSMITIGGATLYYFKKQNDAYHLERLQRKEQSIMLSLDYYVIENDINELNVKLENKIQELADIHNLDFNIYTVRGELMGSTQIELFENGTFPKQIPDSVIQRITRSEQIIVQEKVNDKAYLSTYFTLNTASRKPMAIVNLPYYKDTERNQREVLDFLGTLSQAYILLFLGATILAYILANYLTTSLRTISDRLEKVRITGNNEKLEWRGNDEIKSIVNQYNQMVDELEESAQKLAKSERESAWKEMAKQVAHEIKNPLTPMRLQVQHLQRIAQNNPDDLPNKMNQLANTLIQQIDSLSRIATEFSNFAKMPKPTLAPTNVDQVCSNSISLYSQDQAYISYKIGPGDKNVMADPEQLGRVLTNLIQNAIQAIPDERDPRIEVETLLIEGKAIIRVTDNGSGIPEAEQEKIFEPNFTTKSSGMGLGLAIVKGIINGFNGDIAFVSDTHSGTTFTVSIPTISKN